MIDRVVVLLLAGCALFGSLIFVELTSEDAGAAAGGPVAVRAEPASPARSQGPRIDDLLAMIVSRPLFSPTRQPPSHASPDQPAGLDLADVRLTGIVVEPERHLAIFAVPGAKPLVRSEGETMQDWRLDSITAQEVVLSGPAGTRTLRPKIDTSLVRPAPPPRLAPAAPPSHVAPATPPSRVAPATPPPRVAPVAPPAQPGGPGFALRPQTGAATPPKPPAMPSASPLRNPAGTPMAPLPPPRPERGRE